MNSSICAITWFVKLFDITKLGWPVAHPRFSSRPSASTMIECESRSPSGGNTHSSTWGLMPSRFTPGMSASPAMSISLSKCPMFPTIALCFIRCMSAAVMMLWLPVAVMNRSAVSTTSSRVVTS